MKETVSIIITNRDTKEYLELAIKSIRQDELNKEYEIIIMDDNSNDGSKEWLEQNKDKYNFIYITHNEPNRKGLMILNEEGMSLAKNDIIMLGHSDMYYASECITNMLKYVKEKTIVSATRVEPPIYPQELCRYQMDLGVSAKEFKEEEFNNDIEYFKISKVTNGVFAPTMFYKRDWLPYDRIFLPQSHEDSDRWYEMVKQGYKFIQPWNAYVYHFSGKGSRHYKDSDKDTSEWKASNYKNTRCFIRKWGQVPRYDEYQNPKPLPKDYPRLTLCVPTINDESRIFNFLEQHEPYFDEIVIAYDSKTTDNTLKEIERYIQKELTLGNTNFKIDKIKVISTTLDNDFSKLRNDMHKEATNDWVFHLDTDEMLDVEFMNNIRHIIINQGTKIDVFGFARLNFLNEILVNDIPRHLWTEEYLETLKKNG